MLQLLCITFDIELAISSFDVYVQCHVAMLMFYDGRSCRKCCSLFYIKTPEFAITCLLFWLFLMLCTFYSLWWKVSINHMYFFESFGVMHNFLCFTMFLFYAWSNCVIAPFQYHSLNVIHTVMCYYPATCVKCVFSRIPIRSFCSVMLH